MKDPLRQMFKYKNNEIPEGVARTIDSTIASLPPKRRTHKKRFVQVAAGVALTAFMAANFVNPSFAQNIPVIGSVFTYFQEQGTLAPEYKKYAEGINQTVTDNGVELTITDIVADDSSINIGYTIKSAKPSNLSEMDIKAREELAKAVLQPFGLKINGQAVTGSMSMDRQNTDENTIIGLMTADVGNIDLPESFRLNIGTDSIMGVDGNWEFEFDLSKEAIMNKMEKFELGQNINLDDVKVTMDRVLFSPLNSTLVFSIDKRDLTEEHKDIKGLRTVQFWKVLDEQGNELIFKGSNGGVYSPDDKEVIVYQMDFSPVENIPESLTVIPQEYTNNDTLKDIEGLQFTIPLQ